MSLNAWHDHIWDELERVDVRLLVGAIAGLAASYITAVADGAGTTPNQIVSIAALGMERRFEER